MHENVPLPLKKTPQGEKERGVPPRSTEMETLGLFAPPSIHWGLRNNKPLPPAPRRRVLEDEMAKQAKMEEELEEARIWDEKTKERRETSRATGPEKKKVRENARFEQENYKHRVEEKSADGAGIARAQHQPELERRKLPGSSLENLSRQNELLARRQLWAERSRSLANKANVLHGERTQILARGQPARQKKSKLTALRTQLIREIKVRRSQDEQEVKDEEPKNEAEKEQ
jgi:hypothetical protein